MVDAGFVRGRYSSKVSGSVITINRISFKNSNVLIKHSENIADSKREDITTFGFEFES